MIALTWENLYPLAKDAPSGDTGGAEIAPGVKVHTHPSSPFPREIHFMVNGQKVATLGPPDQQPGEVLLGGYLARMMLWKDQPVHHDWWWRRIAEDNGL